MSPSKPGASSPTRRVLPCPHPQAPCRESWEHPQHLTRGDKHSTSIFPLWLAGLIPARPLGPSKGDGCMGTASGLASCDFSAGVTPGWSPTVCPKTPPAPACCSLGQSLGVLTGPALTQICRDVAAALCDTSSSSQFPSWFRTGGTGRASPKSGWRGRGPFTPRCLSQALSHQIAPAVTLMGPRCLPNQDQPLLVLLGFTGESSKATETEEELESDV